MRLGFDRRNLGEYGVDIDLLATFGALAQISLRIEGGELFGDALLA